MDRFYIITNETKDKDFRITNQIKQQLEECGKKAIIGKKDKNGNNDPRDIPPDAQCALVLGGDGTLIKAANELYGTEIPFLGVNLGTLGYLTEVELTHIPEMIEFLALEEPQIERRMMLYGKLSTGAEGIALNDIVISRIGSLRVVHYSIYVNGELLNSYKADGVIISTPTGSTAYNLSAGGPVVEPTAELMVVTPICSHALNTSSVILSSEDDIQVVIEKGRDGSKEEVEVSYDGATGIRMVTGDCITITKAKKYTSLVKIENISFLETLRKKMKGN